VDDLAFGRPARYLQLDPKLCSKTGFTPLVGDDDIEDDMSDESSEIWDQAVIEASKDFEHRMHMMLCGSDCHSHVAVALNHMEYRGFNRWNKVILAAWMFFRGKHTSWTSVVRTWLGTVLVAIVWLKSRY
jgi:hypothetical protein